MSWSLTLTDAIILPVNANPGTVRSCIMFWTRFSDLKKTKVQLYEKKRLHYNGQPWCAGS